MAQDILLDIEDSLLERLKLKAELKGVPLEDELRSIIIAGAQDEAPGLVADEDSDNR